MLARRGARLLSGRLLPVRRPLRRFSDEAGTGKVKAGAAQEDGWSLRARVGFFSVFVGVGGLATVSYTLNTDEETLFWVYDNYPSVVTTLGPWIGLPMVEETGQLDEEEYFPRSVSELVGESIHAACKLRSGRVIVVQAPSEATNSELEALVCQQLQVASLLGDTVASVTFLDEEQSTALASKSGQALQDEFAIKLEPVPPPGTPREQLQALLNVYRHNEFEFKTQVELGKNHGFDYSQYERALEEVERRKVAVKALM